jgi:surfeit locus 1 family protein
VYSFPDEIMTWRGIPIGGRAFRPRPLWSIATALFVALTVSLGNWQTHRAEQKLEAARRLDAALRDAALSISAAPISADEAENHRVSARGSFVAGATLFLDNKVLRGVAGYHVVTPLRLEGGDVHVLVDRGWIAAGERLALPSVPTPEGAQTIEGIAVVPIRRFLELAPEPATGPLRQNLVIEREEQRLALKLHPFVIEQTSDARDGLARVWVRPDTGVDMHRSYALQWYSFAALAVLLYVVLSFERLRPGRE